jgi:hypothetical protein
MPFFRDDHDKLWLPKPINLRIRNMSMSYSRVLQLALEQLENQKRDLDAEIAELKSKGNNGANRRGRPRKMSSDVPEVSNTEPDIQPKKKMSAAHRLAISQGMKQRWANRTREPRVVE